MQLISNKQSGYTIRVWLDSHTPKPDQFVVADGFTVELFDGRCVVIPEGFTSDGHSTPAWLDSLLPHFNSRTNLAAIVHDYLYMHWEAVEAGVMHDEHNDPDWTWYVLDDKRQYADDVYWHLMEQMAPGYWRNRLYWLAVRLAGGWNWRRFRWQARQG